MNPANTNNALQPKETEIQLSTLVVFVAVSVSTLRSSMFLTIIRYLYVLKHKSTTILLHIVIIFRYHYHQEQQQLHNICNIENNIHSKNNSHCNYNNSRQNIAQLNYRNCRVMIIIRQHSLLKSWSDTIFYSMEESTSNQAYVSSWGIRQKFRLMK